MPSSLLRTNTNGSRCHRHAAVLGLASSCLLLLSPGASVAAAFQPPLSSLPKFGVGGGGGTFMNGPPRLDPGCSNYWQLRARQRQRQRRASSRCGTTGGGTSLGLSFLPNGHHHHQPPETTSSSSSALHASALHTTSSTLPPPQPYSHTDPTTGQTWKLTHRHRPPLPGHESDPILLLIHPVSIGCSSWYWSKVFDLYRGEIYAPDLIGCGLENGGDAWVRRPSQQGQQQDSSAFDAFDAAPPANGIGGTNDDGGNKDLSNVPLSWTNAIETLIYTRIQWSAYVTRPIVVIAQGGLGPVGIKLAYRNPRVISHLVLTSPPAWERLVLSDAYRMQERWKKKVYDTKAIFDVLETPMGFRMLASRKLFKGPPDEEFVGWATRGEANSKAARTPILAYKGGEVNYRSFEFEARRMTQPTLILSGSDDKATRERRMGFGLGPYVHHMRDARHVVLREGKRVLPWENARDVVREVGSFLGLTPREQEEEEFLLGPKEEEEGEVHGGGENNNESNGQRQEEEEEEEPGQYRGRRIPEFSGFDGFDSLTM